MSRQELVTLLAQRDARRDIHAAVPMDRDPDLNRGPAGMPTAALQVPDRPLTQAGPLRELGLGQPGDQPLAPNLSPEARARTVLRHTRQPSPAHFPRGRR